MIIHWRSARYRGGPLMFKGGNQPLWARTFIEGTNAIITLFNGLTTQLRLTGVGY